MAMDLACGNAEGKVEATAATVQDLASETPTLERPCRNIQSIADEAVADKSPAPSEPSSLLQKKHFSRTHPPAASGAGDESVTPASKEEKRTASFSSPVCYASYEYD